MAICIGLALAGAVSSASAEEPGCAYSTMYLVAHEDDSLLFQSPSLLQDIQTERCVRTVFLTAGDAGRVASYWEGRESGAEDAYAQMAGVANQWTGSTITANGHSIHLETLKARPTISIVYMRLPDGNIEGQGWERYGFQSLTKLWRSGNPEEAGAAISSIKAVDNSTTYGYSNLIETLTALMQSFEPRQVYTQNYTVNMIGPDHADHVATGFFSRAASRVYVAPHRLVGFQDYETSSQAQNVTGTLLGGKSAAFYKYGTHDSDACASEPACAGTSYAKWLLRQYFVSSAKWETTGVVANAGFTQLSEPGATINLDGSGSSAQSGSLQYTWAQTLGPAVTLKNASTATPSFTAPSHPTKIVFSLVVKAGATTSKADTVTIKLPSSDPTPTAIAGPTQTVASGASVKLDGTESWDPNSATLTYAWLQTAGPVVTLTGGSTATPSFTAPTGPATIKFSLMVSNGNQTSAPSTVTVNVNGIVPSFTSGTSAPFTTGVAGSFKVTSAGSPTAALTRTEGELPPGLSFVDNADGTATISGTPTAAAAPAGSSQNYPVKVKAANSEGSANQTLTLTVTNPGTAPLFTSGTSTTFTTGVAGSFTVSTVGDPLPTVTKTAGTLPTGLTFTANPNGTATISGTAAAAAAEPGESQDYSLTFKASSDAGNSSQSFTLTVTNPGTAPAFTSANSTTFTTGVAKTFTVTTSGAPAAAISKVSGTLPPGLSLVDQGDGTAKISGIPTNAAAPPGASQEYTVGLKAVNGAGNATQTLTITVSNPGTPPAFTSANSASFTTGTAGSFTVSTSGAPTAAITKTAGALPSGLTLVDQGNGTAKLGGTPTNAAAPPGDSEDYEVTLKAQSLAGNASQTLTITVTNPGVAPTFTSAASSSFTTGVEKTFTLTTAGEPTAAITKTAGTLPTGLTFTANPNGTATISGTAAAAAAEPGESQDYSLTFKASSDAGNSSQSFTLTVTNPGTAPAFTSANSTTFTTGVAKTFTVTTTGAPTASITKTAGTLPPGLSLVDQGNGTAKLSGTPTNAAAPPGESQDYGVTLKAQSLAGNANQTLTITVSNPGTPPSFTSVNSTTFTTGVAKTFTVSTSGAPTAALAKTGTLPTGLTFTDNGDGTATISGTAAAAAAPPASSQGYPLTLEASSLAGNASQPFTLTVANPGTPPAFTSANATTFTTGVAKTFTVTTTGAPTASITKTAGTLPPGLTLVDQGNGTAKLSGTPTNAAAPPGESQEYTVTLKAESGAGSGTQTLTVTVSNPGTAPAFTSSHSASFTTGSAGSFTVTTTGAPTAAITKTSGALPSGLTLVDQGDGTAKLSGTPTNAAAPPGESESYEVALKAANVAGNATQTLTITVTNPGVAPTFTSAASSSFTTGVEKTFTITTSGEPTAALTKTLGSLPTGLAFTDKGNGTATISGTAAASAAEPGKSQGYSLTFKASSLAGNASQSFTLTVTNPGTPPSFTSANATTFTTGVAKTFTVSTSGNPVAALAKSGSLPTGLSFTDNGNGTATISGTASNAAAPPAASQDYPISFEASSLAGTASQSFALKVTNPGAAPSFTSAATAAFTTGVAGSFKISTTAAPTAALTKTVGALPTGLSFTDNGDGTATIAGTPSASAAPAGSSQNYPLTIKAANAVGNTTQGLTLTVTNPGGAPVITSANSAGFTTGTSGSFKVVSVADPTAALTRTGTLPTGVGFSDNGDGTATISGTPAAAAAPAGGSQNYPITIKAANTVASVTQSFTLTVTNPGTPPSFTSVNATNFTTGTAGSFTITTAGDPTATLSKTAGTLPTGLTFTANPNGTATISGTAAASAAPPASSTDYSITVKASSAAGNASQALTITVTNPGTPPSFTSASATTFTTGVAKTFTVSTSGAPTAALARTAGELPDGLAFTDKGNGTATISGTAVAAAAPAAGSQGYPLTFKASSAAGNASQAFTLTVTKPGTAPAITSGTSTSFTTGTAGSFKVVSTGDPTSALSQTGTLPTGVTFSDNGNGTATLAGTAAGSAAPAGSSQSYPITIKATNGAGNASQSFTLTVNNPGTGPSITSAASTSFTTGVAGSFKVTSTGAPTAALSKVGQLPAGLNFVDNGDGTATISGTPAAAAAAPGTSQDYEFTIKASSTVGNVSQSFTLTVVNPGIAPTITSPSSASFTTGVAGSFKVTTDGDPKPGLNRQMGNLPDGLSFSDNGDGTATISGTPAAAAADPGKSLGYPLTIKAQSAAGQITQSFTLTVVNPGAGPIFTSASATTFTTGVAKTFTVSTSGNPVAALARAGSLPTGLTFVDKGNGTATISGTASAAAASAGTSQGYPLTLSASSAAGSASQSFTLTVVNPEQPVVIPPASGAQTPPTIDPPKVEPPVSEPVKVTLSQGKVLLPIGKFSRRVVQVTAPTEASVTCNGKLPKGARCRVVAQRKVVIEASKAVKRIGTFPLTIHVADQDGASFRRRLVVQMLAPDDPALRIGRPGAQG